MNLEESNLDELKIHHYDTLQEISQLENSLRLKRQHLTNVQTTIASKQIDPPTNGPGTGN